MSRQAMSRLRVIVTDQNKLPVALEQTAAHSLPMSVTAAGGEAARIIVTDDERELAAIVHPGVRAVICRPAPASWIAPLTAAVESGQLHIARAILPRAAEHEIESWLHDN